MNGQRNYSQEEMRARLEEMRREEPFKFFMMMIKKEIQYFLRNLKK
ncbi:MAG: hypothetical protein J6D33_10740 [Turicibacter sp.]|nr:hypothetical protein [Turicibacter sp.]